mmetsp:Transcript_24314/g.57560  ORF Transcript_24314/g.57560 Transcript_24314/m.57560 type:complete len:108 (+) Transcript_24314:144-467(+)
MEIVDLHWLRGHDYLMWYKHMDETGGMFTHRWSDAVVRTLGVQMFLAQSEVTLLSLPYRHQELCLPEDAIHCSETRAWNIPLCARCPKEEQLEVWQYITERSETYGF